MIVQESIDYVAGTHKSDTDDVFSEHQPVKSIRVCNGSGATVTLACVSPGGNDFTLEYLDGYCGWDAVQIQRIKSTGTSGDTAANVSIVLAAQ